ncbi:MAG: ion transporter, partial [Pseudomonadota bacterium]
WRNWYEVLGMIPVAHPAIRGFRLFRVVRIVILLARFGMATDRAMGRGFTYALVNRVGEQVAAAISRPVTLAVLDEVVEVLKQGHYTKNVARALDENRDELRAMALEKIAADPEMRRFKRVPFFDDIIAATVESVLRVVSDLLNDPRTDEFVADVLRENIAQIRSAVRENRNPVSHEPS